LKQILFSIVLLFFLTPLFSQVATYKNDVWKVNTLIDTTDYKKLENLKENIPLIKATLIQAIIADSESPKETALNRDLRSKLTVFYKNLIIQESLLDKKILLGKQLKKDLAALEIFKDNKIEYRTARGKSKIKPKLKEYIKLRGAISQIERNLKLQLFPMITSVGSDKRTLNQLVPYFNIALNQIGNMEVKPRLDSLNRIIYAQKDSINLNQITIQDLKEYRRQLEDSITIKRDSFKIIQEGFSKELVLMTDSLKMQTEEEVCLHNLLDSLNTRLEQEGITLSFLQEEKNSLQEEMEELRIDHRQKVDSLSKEHLELEGKIATLKGTINRLEDIEQKHEDNIKELEQIKIDKNNLTIAKNNLMIAMNSLLVFLLFFMVLAWIYSNQKRKELRLRTETLKLRTEALKLSHRELQHRIKNNLQKVTSLIWRRLFSIEDEKAKSILTMLQDELGTIALIHQKLYANEDQKLTLVNIADYAEELVRSIVRQEASVYIHVDPIYIEMDNAVEIGLMLNELVTNAYKYGFPQIDHPAINVHISLKDKFVTLKVQDNGIGFPEGFSINSSTTFGLLAIADIVKRHQKKGSLLNIYNQNGANIEIRLPFDRHLSRLTA